ncbi:MAG: hypothetical protein IJY90_00745 [Clostridia bacterium]|nr:hypothetical protein [Clostridia bacterium]
MIINTRYRCGCAIDVCPFCNFNANNCCNNFCNCTPHCNDCGCPNWQTSCPCVGGCQPFTNTAENAFFFLAGFLLNQKCLH